MVQCFPVYFVRNALKDKDFDPSYIKPKQDFQELARIDILATKLRGYDVEFRSTHSYHMGVPVKNVVWFSKNKKKVKSLYDIIKVFSIKNLIEDKQKEIVQ